MNYTFARFILIFFFISTQISAQPTHYPKGYFGPPMDIPLLLSGNFAELRSNHFHGGLDIKTQGEVGKNITCAADGYVARIKVGIKGYGLVLYVSHPNGYTTVYAHLLEFKGKIADYVKEAQYRNESYTIELHPKPDELPVKKGEIIALSGNSGSSLAPHLHFEIRKTKGQVPVNPLLFDFDIEDDLKPIIKSVAFFPQENGSVNGKSKTATYPVYGTFDSVIVSKKRPIELHGPVGLGIDVQDFLNGARNKCGIYSIELFVNEKSIFYHDLEQVSFEETRYINSLVDYYFWKKHSRRYQKSFLDPGNKLTTYEGVVNQGVYDFKSGKEYHIKYLVKDTYGNETKLEFKVKGQKPSNKVEPSIGKFTKKMDYGVYNSYETDNIIIGLPSRCLYKDLYFKYEMGDTLPNTLTPTHHIHNIYEPLHTKMTVSIKVPEIDDRLKRKTSAYYVGRNNTLSYEGGSLSKGYITFKTKSFGTYTIAMDTIAPSLTPINIRNGAVKNMRGNIQVKIDDKLSGIRSYRGSIDGKWILFEYDYKNRLLTYSFDSERLKTGSHQFNLVISDK
ncbi:MAG: M23 family metallopeptidase, partial [Flavobacteriales bacterium]|nr:M23 family metallopeptidase [Flavobacteriales bacterium]